MQVYKAIADVALEMSKEGISKDQKNTNQDYNFRGIDDVYNALAPVMAKNRLVMLPRVLNRDVTEKNTARGSVLFYVTVEVEYDLVSAEDGSKHTIKTFGEAMDSGDKATNKAMSAAFKYACMQAFCIPTEGDNDADASTYKVVQPPKIDHGEYLSRYAKVKLNGSPFLYRDISQYSEAWFKHGEDLKNDPVNITVLNRLIEKAKNNDFINSDEILSVCLDIKNEIGE